MGMRNLLAAARAKIDGWDAGADPDAVAGKDAEGMAVRLRDGTYAYKMTERGVMSSVALAGTRYWQSEAFNAGLD